MNISIMDPNCPLILFQYFYFSDGDNKVSGCQEQASTDCIALYVLKVDYPSST